MNQANDLWERYRRYLCRCESIGLDLDISRMQFDPALFERMSAPMSGAFEEMDALERGAIANPDEHRRVGHYWLRDPDRAPDASTRRAIVEVQRRIADFAGAVHSGRIAPQRADRFTDVLVIGIGGSALGPQFVADALGEPDRDAMRPWFFDNTDPDGMDRTLRALGERLAGTLVVVISKSGQTPETRNGMLVAAAAYERAGLDFAAHAVAITGAGSQLDRTAERDGWLGRFPMWDWVGGRTSQTSAVGLVPAALQGLDIDGLLAGAAACDAVTRAHDLQSNPAARLALVWYSATGGRGEKDMVILPYKDRLVLFSRYLQQLVMESLGKRHDRDGRVVEQGIAVYGNKGSTDQHAYVQQLREGVNNFFVTFIDVAQNGGAPLAVEPGVTSGDYLRGLRLGTRQALCEAGRESITISVRRVDAYHVGVLIALYERAVGLYASLVGINAYHQPGVEAGKQAAADVLALQTALLEALGESGQALTAAELAARAGRAEDVETAWHLLRGLAADDRVRAEAAADPAEERFATA